MHNAPVNDNESSFVKNYTCSLLDTLQSKNLVLVEKSQPNLRRFLLTGLAEKILNTVVNGLNFSIPFELLRGENVSYF